MKKDTNEIRILKEFVKEFSPFFNDIDHNGREITDTMTYAELVREVKEITKAL